MAKKWLVYITPFTVLVIVLAAMAFVHAGSGKLSGEAKALLNVAEVVIIIPSIIIDVVLRLLCKAKPQWVWLIEAILLVIFCFVFIKK